MVKSIDWSDGRSGTYRGAYRYPTEAERVIGYAERHRNKNRRYRANLRARGITTTSKPVLPLIRCSCSCGCQSSMLESGSCGFCQEGMHGAD